MSPVFSLLLASVLVYTAHACDFPLRLWCSSEEIARQCNVYEQCKNTHWGGTNSSRPQPHPDAQLVDVTLYYESYCGGCRLFIRDTLEPTYQKVGEIMNVTLVPYGESTEEMGPEGRWYFSCHRGRKECIGNRLETCAINLSKNVSDYLPFLACLDERVEPLSDSAKECAKNSTVPIDDILHCIWSDQGNVWEHEMGLLTNHQVPDYVPWITLNGVHNSKIQHEAVTDLRKLVCDTYKGVKPLGCSDYSQ